MGVLGAFALVILLILGFALLAVWFALAILPGRIARERGHPQADAISVCGWMGALTLGVLSPLAFVWAYTRPVLRPIELEPPAEPAPAESPTADEREAD